MGLYTTLPKPPPPAADHQAGLPPLIPVTTLRELHDLAGGIGGLLGKIDNITHVLGGLTDRFDDERDGAAADYLLAEIENISTAVDDELFKITRALRSFLEGERDE